MSAADDSPLEPPPPGGEALQEFLERFTVDDEIGVGIITSEGKTIWCNDRAAEIFHGEGARAEDYIGTWWRDVLPPEWVAERLELLSLMREDDRPVLMRTVWRGHQHVTWIRRIERDDRGGPDRFVTVTKRVPGVAKAHIRAGERYGVVESSISRLGPLDRLTGRELEAFILMSRGKDDPVARTLYRDWSLAERTRSSMLKKLQSLGPGELSELASNAGLTLRDLGRRRV